MSKSPSSKKQQSELIQALHELLQNKTVGTQADIQAALEKQGFVVNQTKISRILHKLRAIKQIEHNETVYRLPTERPSISSRDPLKLLVISIKHNENLVIIKTTPGSAQLVASFLDQKPELNILGTLAGDDTVFIAPDSEKNILILYNEIYKLLL